VKRVAGLRDLSDDHHTGLVLARRCKQAGQPGASEPPEAAWAHARDAFARHLAPHFRVEEEALLPALEALGEAALAERIRAEHRALEALEGTQPATRDLLSRFGALLESHIRSEEREVFEPTQHRLPQSALEAIARAHRERLGGARAR
jgi:hemerythrin-like domain-containing protein